MSARIRKTIHMPFELVMHVDKLRSNERPIPSFSNITCTLVERGLSVYDVVEEKEEEIDEMLVEIEGKGSKRERESKSTKPKRKIERISPKFCDHCGRSLEKGIKFCDGCGTLVI
jgi:hypothetical protein